MTGRTEVSKLKQRLDATFDRVKGVGQDTELQSDFARYLCVLVSGYIEKAVVELVLEHTRRKGQPTLQRFVEQRTEEIRECESLARPGAVGRFRPGLAAGA